MQEGLRVLLPVIALIPQESKRYDYKPSSVSTRNYMGLDDTFPFADYINCDVLRYSCLLKYGMDVSDLQAKLAELNGGLDGGLIKEPHYSDAVRYVCVQGKEIGLAEKRVYHVALNGRPTVLLQKED
ncbi:hypothetical protein Tco_0662098 [Tanacetum coccineum]